MDVIIIKGYLLLFLCFVFLVFTVGKIYDLLPERMKAEQKAVQTSDNIDYIRVYMNRTNKTVEFTLEDYVKGLLACVDTEMPNEALKAMAVALRTNATYIVNNRLSIHKNADFCDGCEFCGRFKTEITSATANAVDMTKGEMVLYDGKPIHALTHRSSSNKTESAIEVFGKNYPYLLSVDNINESGMPLYSQTKEFAYSDLADIFRRNGCIIDESLNHGSWITYLSYTEGNRVKTVFVFGKHFTGNELSKILGLPSASFSYAQSKNGFVFTSQGIGNGVGMSEYGACLMAEGGDNYKQILVHYYLGTYISVN